MDWSSPETAVLRHRSRSGPGHAATWSAPGRSPHSSVLVDDVPDGLVSDACSSCGGMDQESLEAASVWSEGVRWRKGPPHESRPTRPTHHKCTSSTARHDPGQEGRTGADRQTGAPGAVKRPRDQRPTAWLIPAEHPLKRLWDLLTIVLSIVSAYTTHVSIRDRQYRSNALWWLCDAWFLVDVLLNFFTQKQHSGRLLDTYQTVWARYLTSWFIIDVLSLFPGERLFVQPIIDRQNKRNLWVKTFFRSRAVVRVTRLIRQRHVQWLQRCAKHTKQLFGYRLLRLRSVKLVIRYVPKYLMFFRNMRVLVAIRLLRQIHWLTRMWKQWRQQRRNDRVRLATGTTGNAVKDQSGEVDASDNSILADHSHDVEDEEEEEYEEEDWEYILDDDEDDRFLENDSQGQDQSFWQDYDDDSDVGPF